MGFVPLTRAVVLGDPAGTTAGNSSPFDENSPTRNSRDNSQLVEQPERLAALKDFLQVQQLVEGSYPSGSLFFFLLSFLP